MLYYQHRLTRLIQFLISTHIYVLTAYSAYAYLVYVFHTKINISVAILKLRDSQTT